jgi:hypothetical protein
MNKPLEGVKCIVTTCAYNKDGNKCTAESILVEPKHAHTSDDTDCSTFKPLK